jgi:UDP-N-acetylmuramoyl-tripeptide--D-alanyl-D-alanine ligase
MLQASEYDILHFFKWHERVDDFRVVEKRKKLDRTFKVSLIFCAGLLTLVAVCFAAVNSLFFFSAPWNYVASVVLLVEAPLFAVSGMVLSVFVLRLLQVPVEWLLVARARHALSSHKALKIAIAGSYGKTSTREILRAVLSEGKKVAAPGGSHNTPLAISFFVRKLRGDEEAIIFELGEYYPGDVRRLCELVRPDIGIITGVNEAHLEKFGTLEKTADTVFELADFLKDKPVYINGENEIARMRAGERHIVYSRQGTGAWSVVDAKTGVEGTTLTLKHDNVQITSASKLLGLHMVGPLVLAAHIGGTLGLTLDQLQRGIARTRPFEHRLEPKFGDDGVVTLDDSYNGNPDGVAAVIEFLASVKANRRWYVTPGLVEMGARKEEVHKEIGAKLARARIDKIVLIRNSVTPYIAEGLKEAGYEGEVTWFDDGLAAYMALPRMTVKGDVVLLQNDWPDQYS